MLREHDMVTSRKDPLQYGRMIIVADRGGGWWQCESIHIKDPNRKGYAQVVLHEDELQHDSAIA